MLDPRKASVKRRLVQMIDIPDVADNTLRVVDPWDPSADPELEGIANVILANDLTDGPSHLTVDKLRSRREREVYSPENRIEQSAGLYVRSTPNREMGAVERTDDE